MATAAILNLLFLFILVKCPLPVADLYIAAKFHSSKSIGGRVIAVFA